MMPTAEGMSHMIPAHVLRVGQTIQVDSAAPEAKTSHHLSNAAALSVNQLDNELDISLENLNQLILELDPTFEPVQIQKSPTSDEDVSSPVLIPRGCSANSSPRSVIAVSPSITIPSPSGLSCSPQGTVVFSGSPSSSLPPLPCGSVVRRSPIPRQDGGVTQNSWSLSQPNRISALSLLSTSSCSDTSYILGSTLSLTSEDADSSEFNITPTGSYIGHSSEMLLSPKNKHLTGLHYKQVHSSPASLSGSFTDIPVLLINGAPQPEIQSCPPSPAPQMSSSKPPSPHSPLFFGSQPTMKFVMDTSKLWFRPHISRAEAEAMVKDKEPGTFVIRDSTSYKGSFGLAMKVDQSPTTFAASAYPGDNISDLVRHFLIESSAKGVRIKGASQEPYFGSLPALVYQHTISAYALPCRLLLSQELGATENKATAEDKKKTASNFVYLNAVPTETLTGPCAVQKAVTVTFEKASGSFTPAIVNLKVSPKGVTLTDINRKLFFRRHYPIHLLSYSGEDPDNRRWMRGSNFGAKMFGFVAKGVEAGMENMCHVFAEYDPLQPCDKIVQHIQTTITKT
ncbi:tensin-4-like [Periophthalmus magnuspinnatus]|uniref:tensin-4-like n=1 Tax=Periophthalmus magnuspinnatus TaxID=409849 RepID=UPI00145B0E97|nr:tensin-4-like [Periophthalmus magnuspinnatus]